MHIVHYDTAMKVSESKVAVSDRQKRTATRRPLYNLTQGLIKPDELSESEHAMLNPPNAHYYAHRVSKQGEAYLMRIWFA